MSAIRIERNRLPLAYLIDDRSRFRPRFPVDCSQELLGITWLRMCGAVRRRSDVHGVDLLGQSYPAAERLFGISVVPCRIKFHGFDLQAPQYLVGRGGLRRT